MTHWPPDITLTGTNVTLAPLSQMHAPDLKEATADGDLHRLWYTTVPSAAAFTSRPADMPAQLPAPKSLPLCPL